mgnify:CR=1 FL=1
MRSVRYRILKSYKDTPHGTDVHKGFNKHTETVQSYFQKRTFFNNPLLRYNVLAKEDFAL